MGTLPPDVTAELRRIGRTLTPEAMDEVRGLIARLHQAAGYQAPRIA
jgi:hypothetical protein